MDENIMQVARAVACLARLRILSRLVREQEVAPSVLARELHMPLPVVCAHLRRLTAVGLIQRRRSGAWSYAVARSPTGACSFNGRVATWLFSMLKQPERTLQQSGERTARGGETADAAARLHAMIFEAATAFTDSRRLRLLRYLASEGRCDGDTVVLTLKMSRMALSRHSSKLIRRGYAVATRARHACYYELCRAGKTPIHTRFLDLVRSAWQDSAERS